MAAILQTTFSSAFSWMKIYKFLLIFHWRLFTRVQLTIIPASVQIMTWRLSGDKPFSEPMVFSLLTDICVSLPQWVNELRTPSRRNGFVCMTTLQGLEDWVLFYMIGRKDPNLWCPRWYNIVFIYYQCHCDWWLTLSYIGWWTGLTIHSLLAKFVKDVWGCCHVVFKMNFPLIYHTAQ